MPLSRKILCAGLVVAILASIAAIAWPFPFSSGTVVAGDLRGGFNLVPDKYDAAGIDPDSTFTLKSQAQITLEDIVLRLSIDGEPKPQVSLVEEGTFRIVPSRILLQNKLYTFRIVAADEADTPAPDADEADAQTPTPDGIYALSDITWTFQTNMTFAIIGTLPADKSSGVPLNSGIEIYFSHDTYEDAEKYFEITPRMEGRFERHKKVLVFVPQNSLEQATVYTVTIRKGLKLSGTSQELQEDFSFSFETGLSETGEKEYADRFKGFFSYNRSMYEYSPDEKPWVPFYFYVNRDRVTDSIISINTAVYAYRDMTGFVSAMLKREAVPSWAYLNYRKNPVASEGLSKVLDFNQEFSTAPQGEQFITLPQALPAGFYLIDSTWDDYRFQTFIQVTEIGMYMMKANNKTLIWLNELGTGKPLYDANVEQINPPKESGSSSSNTSGDSSSSNTSGDSSSSNTSGDSSSSDTISDGSSGDSSSSDTISDGSSSNSSDSSSSGLIGVQKTDASGIASFDSIDTEGGTVFLGITALDGRQAVLSYQSYFYRYYDGGSGHNLFWNYLQLDRNLYRPDDTVNFWGMIRERYPEIPTGKLSIELSKGYWFYRPVYYSEDSRMGQDAAVKTGMPMYYPFRPDSQTMIRQDVTSQDGVFSGNIKLPVLEQGNYVINLKSGEEVIAGTYITVEDYKKPSYKIDIAKNREALFPGQEVEYTIKAAFFEGTGIPDLDLRYGINGVIGDAQVSGSTHTDSGGIVKVRYSPSPSQDIQGENYAGIYCSALLPEMGEISQNASVRVFVNDINVALSGSIKDGTATVGAAVNLITLDRLNDGTAKDSQDFLSDPVAGKSIQGTIYRNTWVKVESGQYYDFINKVTRKSYNYNLNKQAAGSISMQTGTDGSASYSFPAPDIKEGYYTVEMNCVDNSGRPMKFEIYLGKYYDFSVDYQDNRYYLDNVKNAYKIGEQAELIFKKGTEPVNASTFLFIRSQNGIRSFEVKNDPSYTFGFSTADMPNTYVTGVFFNGTTYIESEMASIMYDYQERKLDIKAETDKATYRPGETASIRITVTDAAGNPVKAAVNAGVVDEALFSLSEQYVDTLSQLFAGVPSGIEFNYASHLNSGMESVEQNGGMGDGGGEADMASNRASQKASPEMAFDTVTGMGDEARVREVFKDTAFFETIFLDTEGKGELRFELPDNITSWRVTLSALSSGLNAGSGRTAIEVSLPFFINYSLNTTYLTGDIPVLGTTAYGKDLLAGSIVTFEATSARNPSFKAVATGEAFKRVHLELWPLSEPGDEITIKAYTNGGLQDAVKHSLKVYGTYHEIGQAEYYDVKPGISIQGGRSGNTTVIFTDRSMGIYMPPLSTMLYTAGIRLDREVASAESLKLLKQYFDYDDAQYIASSFKPSDYQKEDGGMALLPYGGSDTELSAKIAGFITDQVDMFKLKQYFHAVSDGALPGSRAAALMGLAALREPVLLDIDKEASAENATIRDIIYLALAYCELGELPQAERIYTEKIVPRIEELEPMYRIDTGTDNDDIIECTSLAAIVASYLNKPHKAGLYEYCMNNAVKDIVTDIEQLKYIDSELKKAPSKPSKLTYTYLGQKYDKDLTELRCFQLEIPSTNIGLLKIVSATGEISAVSLFRAPLADTSPTDGNIKVTRIYQTINGQDTTRFNQSDIVRICLDWSFSEKALDGSYELTDYLPSGMQALENTWNYVSDPGKSYAHGRIDGQKVRFHAYNSLDNRSGSLWYYARVISPGRYTGEKPIMQSLSSLRSFNFGNGSIIEIAK